MGLFLKFLILVLLVFFATESQAQFKPAEQQYLGESNISTNGGFEQGKTNWTNVNGTFSVGSTNKLFGQNAGCVTLTAQSLDLKNTSVTTSMSGLQGYVSAYVKTNFPAQLCSIVDNVEETCENIPYDNTYKQIQIPTVLGSTNLGVKLKSTSQTGTICVDNASFGTAKLTQDIAQAQLAGEAVIYNTTNCLWQRGSTTVGAFGVDADCPSPTILRQNLGEWQTIDADLPRFTVNNLPAGQYKATMYFSTYMVSGATPMFSIYDGTSTCVGLNGNFDPNNPAGQIVSCTFEYNTSGNRSFELYAASSSSTINLGSTAQFTGGSAGLKFQLEYYPPKSKIVSQLSENYRVTGAGNAGTVLGANTTNIDFTETSDIGGYWNGTQYTAPENGNYLITGNVRFTTAIDPIISAYVNGVVRYGIAGNVGAVQSISIAGVVYLNKDEVLSLRSNTGATLQNNTQLHNIYIAKVIDTSTIIGRFKEVPIAPNTTNMKVCYYAFGGAGSLSSPTSCISSPCTEYYDSCSAITAPTRTATGRYNVTVADGTFKANSFFKCETEGFVNGAIRFSQQISDAGFHSISTNSNGGIVLRIAVQDNGSTDSDAHISIKCEAEAP